MHNDLVFFLIGETLDLFLYLYQINLLITFYIRCVENWSQVPEVLFIEAIYMGFGSRDLMALAQS